MPIILSAGLRLILTHRSPAFDGIAAPQFGRALSGVQYYNVWGHLDDGDANGRRYRNVIVIQIGYPAAVDTNRELGCLFLACLRIKIYFFRV